MKLQEFETLPEVESRLLINHRCEYREAEILEYSENALAVKLRLVLNEEQLHPADKYEIKWLLVNEVQVIDVIESVESTELDNEPAVEVDKSSEKESVTDMIERFLEEYRKKQEDKIPYQPFWPPLVGPSIPGVPKHPEPVSPFQPWVSPYINTPNPNKIGDYPSYPWGGSGVPTWTLNTSGYCQVVDPNAKKEGDK